MDVKIKGGEIISPKIKMECLNCKNNISGIGRKYCSNICKFTYWDKTDYLENCRKRDKEYYYKNKEKILKRHRAYHKKRNQRDDIKLKKRKYYQINKGRWKNKVLTEEQRKIKNKKMSEKKKTDTKFRIRWKLTKQLRKALHYYLRNGKTFHSKKYGINYSLIIENLKPFPEDISRYHIDHIKPLCAFDLGNPEEVKQAFAPENHQWLTIEQNLKKGGRWNGS